MLSAARRNWGIAAHGWGGSRAGLVSHAGGPIALSGAVRRRPDIQLARRTATDCARLRTRGRARWQRCGAATAATLSLGWAAGAPAAGSTAHPCIAWRNARPSSPRRLGWGLGRRSCRTAAGAGGAAACAWRRWGALGSPCGNVGGCSRDAGGGKFRADRGGRGNRGNSGNRLPNSPPRRRASCNNN